MCRIVILSVCFSFYYFTATDVNAAAIQKRHAQVAEVTAAIETPGLLNLATRLHNIAGTILNRAHQSSQNRGSVQFAAHLNNGPNYGFGPPPPGPPGYHPPPPGFQGHHPPPPPPPQGGYQDWYGGYGHPGFGPPGFGPPGFGPPDLGPPGGPPRPEFGPPPPPPPPPPGPYPYHGGFPQQPGINQLPQDEDKKLISGYIDGGFPVILLDQENEIRR